MFQGDYFFDNQSVSQSQNIFIRMSHYESSVASSHWEEEKIYPLSEIHRFIKDCMMAIGTPESHADAFAISLREADYRGHFCEGISQLGTYMDEIRHGACNKNAVPKIIKETPVTAWVDGNNGLGTIVANFCMDLAIKKAQDSGIGWVVAKGSNKYGIAGLYPLQALKKGGLLAMNFSNSSPMVAPSRAREGALGTNPLAISAPALNGDSFVLDMATAAVSVGKIEMLSKKRLPVPPDWADPKTGALRPLGGQEPYSNYKGFGLGLFVEIVCGILGDSAFGPNIRKYGNVSEIPNLGHCFVVLNLGCFAPGFEERLSNLLDYLRNMTPADPLKPVLVPGDTEREHMAMVDRLGGIPYSKEILSNNLKIAQVVNVKPLCPLE